MRPKSLTLYIGAVYTTVLDEVANGRCMVASKIHEAETDMRVSLMEQVNSVADGRVHDSMAGTSITSTPFLFSIYIF